MKMRRTALEVLQSEANAILGLIDRIDANFEKAVELLAACKGRVVLTGMGKSGIICRKIAATFSSTGQPAFFLHPAEAIHDDQLLKLNAEDVMTRDPITIAADDLATKALNLMEQKRITSLLILDQDKKVQGIIHLHDLWRTEMF